MLENGIVIVDDSPFSIAIIRNILEENGYEVVGEAGNLQEVKDIVKEKNPSLVTMDMTLPDTDGLECTRAIHEINEDIKVIVVSSMMDDEIVKEAKKNKVSDYIQKPIDPDELIVAIERVMDAEGLYNYLQKEYVPVFKETLLNSINTMTKTLLTYKDEYPGKKELKSKGIAVIIGIIGEFSGRVIIDLSKDTSRNLVESIMKKEVDSSDDIVLALGELSNIISGNACSILNRKNKALGLRVAPPSILRGKDVTVSESDFPTTTLVADTEFGEIVLNVGFKRGEGKWM